MYLSVCIYVSMYLSAYLSLCIYLSIFLFIYVCIYVCLSICLSVYVCLMGGGDGGTAWWTFCSAVVFRPAVGLFCPPSLPPDVSHANGPRLGAVVRRGSVEDPWRPVWTSWPCCLTVGRQSALRQPRHRLFGSAGAAFISTLGWPSVSPAAFCGWAIRYPRVTVVLWVAPFEGLPRARGRAADIDGTLALGQLSCCLAGIVGLGGLSTVGWPILDPATFCRRAVHCW